MKYSFTVTENEEMRLDKLIAGNVDGISRSKSQKLIEDGKVTVNGEICNSTKMIPSQGDIIEIEYEDEIPELPSAEDIPLDVVYEDNDIIVINKPFGMVVHPGAGNHSGTVVNALIYHVKAGLPNLNGDDRPGIVHRIDKDTSGLIVCAKTEEAFIKLSEQFQDHSIHRKYLALVVNDIKTESGTIDAPLGRDPKDRLRRAVNGSAPRRAVTHYKVLEHLGEHAYVECELETGRTHQIRVHMAYIGHPVVGDPLYGSRKNRRKADGQYLHAMTLGFIHPTTGNWVEFSAEAPTRFGKMLSLLRRKSKST